MIVLKACKMFKKSILVTFLIIFLFPGYSNAAMTVWAVGESAKVGRTAAAQTLNHVWDSGASSISINGAKKEYVGFQVVISNSAPLSNVNLTASDLTGINGSIGSTNITFFKELYFSNTYPDALVPFSATTDGAPFSVAAGSNQPVWIDVFIPKNTSAGLYYGTVTVTASGETTKSLNLTLKVYNFALPAVRHLKAGLVYYPDILYTIENLGTPDANRAAKWNYEKQYYVMAHEHCFDLVAESLSPVASWDASGNASANWTAFDGYVTGLMNGTAFSDGAGLQMWQSPINDYHPKPTDFGAVFGVCNTSVTPISVTTQPTFTTTFSNAVSSYSSEVYNHFQSKGWGNTLFTQMYSNSHVYDEPAPGFYPSVRTMYDLIHKGNPNLKIMHSGIPDPLFNSDINDWYGWIGSNGLLTGAGSYGSYVNIWCTPPSAYVSDYSSYNGVNVKLGTQNGGVESWIYQSGEPSIGESQLDLGIGMRTWAWIAWRYKVDAAFYWCTNNWTADPYTSQNAGGDGVLFYPGYLKGYSGPISSVRMKNFRRGMQDYEYMWLAKQSGANVDVITNGILGANQLGYKYKAGGSTPDWNANPENWDKAIEQLALQIITVTPPTTPDLSNVKTYPNPFVLREGKTLKLVNLSLGVDFVVRIHNAGGELVKTLRHNDFGALGNVEWDGKNEAGVMVGRGVYYFTVAGEGALAKGKIALIK